MDTWSARFPTDQLFTRPNQTTGFAVAFSALKGKHRAGAMTTLAGPAPPYDLRSHAATAVGQLPDWPYFDAPKANRGKPGSQPQIGLDPAQSCCVD